jgi:site-specific recombinase XerD
MSASIKTKDQKAPASQEDSRVPAGVFQKHGSYYLVRKNKWTKLCRVDEGSAVLHQKLFELNHGDKGTVPHAILSYLKSGMSQLAEPTRKTYQTTSMRMLHHWGRFRLDEIEQTHVAMFLEWCVGENRAILGNREKAFMSSVYEYARRQGWTSSNPFRGVKRNKERSSREEVPSALLARTLDRAPPHLLPLLALAYLWGMRQTDMRLLTLDAIKAKGISWQESKTGKENHQEITTHVSYFLRMAVDYREAIARRYERAAAKLQTNGQHKRAVERLQRAEEVRAERHVFLSSCGRPWTADGLQRAFKRFKLPFKFRLIRPKAQTDAQDKNVLGHMGQLRERYTRARKLQAVR